MENKNSNLKQFARVGKIFPKALTKVLQGNTKYNTVLESSSKKYIK